MVFSSFCPGQTEDCASAAREELRQQGALDRRRPDLPLR
jgi:hypothetical protein